MAASKGNYLIVYDTSSQVFAATTLETAVKTPLPKGCTIEGKQILFTTFEPDSGKLCVYKIDQGEVDKVLEKITKQQEQLKQLEQESSDEQVEDNS